MYIYIHILYVKDFLVNLKCSAKHLVRNAKKYMQVQFFFHLDDVQVCTGMQAAAFNIRLFHVHYFHLRIHVKQLLNLSGCQTHGVCVELISLIYQLFWVPEKCFIPLFSIYYNIFKAYRQLYCLIHL